MKNATLRLEHCKMLRDHHSRGVAKQQLLCFVLKSIWGIKIPPIIDSAQKKHSLLWRRARAVSTSLAACSTWKRHPSLKPATSKLLLAALQLTVQRLKWWQHGFTGVLFMVLFESSVFKVGMLFLNNLMVSLKAQPSFANRNKASLRSDISLYALSCLTKGRALINLMSTTLKSY